MVESVRYTKTEVRKLLGLSLTGFDKFLLKHPEFPKGDKDGDTPQAPVYYDKQQVHDWYEVHLAKVTYQPLTFESLKVPMPDIRKAFLQAKGQLLAQLNKNK